MPATIYVARPDNEHFLGPAPLEQMARHIAESEGPSGRNDEYLLELAAWLRERTGWPSLVTWTPGEEALAESVAAASRGAARVSPAWTRLGELTHLLDLAGLVVGADTGPTHLAAAQGTPTVALFGPKDPALYAPFGESVAVVWNRVSCSPCTLRFCPDPICMSTMSVRDVREAVEELIGPELATRPS